MLTELGPNVVHIKPPGHEVILKSGAQNMPVVLIEPAVPPTNRQDCENSNNSTHSGMKFYRFSTTLTLTSTVC